MMIEVEPKIGDIRQGLRPSGRRVTYVYVACLGCSKERWVELRSGKLRALLCRRCSQTQTETRAKHSKALMGKQYNKGHRHTQEWKDRMSILQKALPHQPLNIRTKEKLRKINLGKKLSEDTKNKIGQASKEHWCNPELREKTIQGLKKLYLDPIFKAEAIRKMHLGAAMARPNKPEQVIQNMLDRIAPNDWDFVGGNRDFIVGGKNPDFALRNGGKKLIEVFGVYWHGAKARTYEETEEGRIEWFGKFGYETLVIWDIELYHPEIVIFRLGQFLSPILHA